MVKPQTGWKWLTEENYNMSVIHYRYLSVLRMVKNLYSLEKILRDKISHVTCFTFLT